MVLLIPPAAFHAMIGRALKSAARRGVDPYNSHTVQAAKWARAWADRARRTHA